MPFPRLKPRDLASFARKNVSLGEGYAVKGRLDLSKSPYLLGPAEALSDWSITKVSTMGPVQTGKSLINDAWIPYVNYAAPDATQINMQTDDDAELHGKRIHSVLETTDCLRERIPTKRHLVKKNEINLTDSFILIQGANLSGLQSKSIRYQSNDEIPFWRQEGLTKEANGRLGFYSWRAKQHNLAQGGVVGDEWDTIWKKGTREIWSWECPHCQHIQPYKWSFDNNPATPGGIKWQKTDDTYQDGEWNFEELAKTIVLECQGCKAHFHDTPAERALLERNSRYVVTNPKAQKGHRSFRWHVLACKERRWSDLVAEWLEAIDLMHDGDDTALKAFIQKRCAEPYDEAQPLFEVKSAKYCDYALTQEGIAPAWPDAFWRVMTVDVQKDHYWAQARDWAQDGRSRYVWSGKLGHYLDIEAQRKAIDIDRGKVFIDVQYNTHLVYLLCCIFGWKGLRGDDKEGFRHKDGDDIIWKPWSNLYKYKPLMGGNHSFSRDEIEQYNRSSIREAAVIEWSNPFFKDLLQTLYEGKGVYWGYPTNHPGSWKEQMEGERKVKKRRVSDGRVSHIWKKVGKAGDHLRDCESMQLVVAGMKGFLGIRNVKEGE